MKKLFRGMVVMAMVLAFSVPAMAHPRVPEQSIQKVNENAAGGMHTAWGSIQGSNGAAQHNFMYRHSPH